jgi:hypothetical protein
MISSMTQVALDSLFGLGFIIGESPAAILDGMAKYDISHYSI